MGSVGPYTDFVKKNEFGFKTVLSEHLCVSKMLSLGTVEHPKLLSYVS